MRKVFSTLAVLFAAVSVGFGQITWERDSEYFPHHEVYIQYGAPSLVELTTTLTSKINAENLAGESKNHVFTGIPAIGYNYFINRNLSIGADFGYGRAQAEIWISSLEGQPVQWETPLCTSMIDCYMFHLSASYIYWEGPSMEISGAVYLGVNYMDETVLTNHIDLLEIDPNDRLNFSYHLTAMKFRYGETVGGFVELGFGYRGLVNLGLSIKI